MAMTVTETIKQEKGSIVIGMGETAVSANPGVILTCIGLGSCIAVAAYDKTARIGGMIHIVLAKHQGNSTTDFGKFADTGIPLLFNEMNKLGADKRRLSVKIAGGAQMTIAPGLKDTFKTGERNLVQILYTLEQEDVGLKAADVGGCLGRTVKLHLDTGMVTVKTVNGIEREI
jgi:chemotaxis protein CheD